MTMRTEQGALPLNFLVGRDADKKIVALGHDTADTREAVAREWLPDGVVTVEQVPTSVMTPLMAKLSVDIFGDSRDLGGDVLPYDMIASWSPAKPADRMRG